MSKEHYSVHDLLDIMRTLRHPQSGCPWDIKQTFESIAPYTVEEAYEVADAISRGDMNDLCDELGDLLLQVVYHAEMATEENYFSFDDVVNAICQKMVRRHPHVFGVEEDITQGKPDWETIKSQERREQGKQDDSALAHVPAGLPALLRARKLQKKAAKLNFDWPDYHGVIGKLNEEMAELEQALNSGSQTGIKEEIGDIMFSVVNLCRHLKVDADIALQQANSKFESRFRTMETLAASQDSDLQDLASDQLESLWDQAKLSKSIE